jgi:hypothetical protein
VGCRRHALAWLGKAGILGPDAFAWHMRQGCSGPLSLPGTVVGGVRAACGLPGSVAGAVLPLPKLLDRLDAGPKTTWSSAPPRPGSAVGCAWVPLRPEAPSGRPGPVPGPLAGTGPACVLARSTSRWASARPRPWAPSTAQQRCGQRSAMGARPGRRPGWPRCAVGPAAGRARRARRRWRRPCAGRPRWSPACGHLSYERAGTHREGRPTWGVCVLCGATPGRAPAGPHSHSAANPMVAAELVERPADTLEPDGLQPGLPAAFHKSAEPGG